MAVESDYQNKHGRRINVVYPTKAAPIVLQSCYVFGPKEHRGLCQKINLASQTIFETVMMASHDRDLSASVAGKLVDEMIGGIDYERLGTGQFDTDGPGPKEEG